MIGFIKGLQGRLVTWFFSPDYREKLSPTASYKSQQINFTHSHPSPQLTSVSVVL